MELVRDVVVAAIDERRLMVSQFYIESREHALRASEEKYRNSIDHAPDPMYEIEPYTLDRAGRQLRGRRDVPNRSRTTRTSRWSAARLTELGPPEDIPHILQHVEKVVRDGSDQIRDWPEAGRYFDVNSALISFGKVQFVQMILHDVTQRREMLDELLKHRAAGRGRHLRHRRRARGQQSARLDLVAGAVAGAGRDRRRAAHLAAHDSLADHAHLEHAQGPGQLRAALAGAAQADSISTIRSRETLRLVAYNKRFAGHPHRAGAGRRPQARIRRQQRDSAGPAQPHLQRRRRDPA